MIPIKTAEEIAGMREACRVAAEVLDAVARTAIPGVTTYDLDQLARRLIEDRGAESACHNYHGTHKPFPAFICISVNEEVVHGIGSIRRILAEGDVVALDVVVRYRGFIGDNARTIPVGEVDPRCLALIRCAEDAFSRALTKVRPGCRVGDISWSIQNWVESRGFSVVRDFVGHGIGRSMHEEPQIPNFGRKKTGAKLRPGMTLAIEPMVNLGRPEVEVLDDSWTVVTRDRLPSAHHEHTVLVTEGEPEILTLPGPVPVSTSS
ncbi:MAG: type I methionyl aminopeptidase [Puniceicoccaceae bacterium]|nr:MAG: type I methionyl aminopeptidase [Puniceicoccaceae bacterium]